MLKNINIVSRKEDPFKEPYVEPKKTILGAKPEPLLFSGKIEPIENQDVRITTQTPQVSGTTKSVLDDTRGFFDPIPDRVRPRDWAREFLPAAHEIGQDIARYSWALSAGIVAQFDEPIRIFEPNRRTGGYFPTSESIINELSKRWRILTESKYEPRYSEDDKIDRKLEEFILGKDQEPFSLSTIGVGFLKDIGVPDDQALKYGPLAASVMVATDWTPIPSGKGAKGPLSRLAKRFSKTTDVVDISKTLRKLNTPEDLINIYAPLLARETSQEISTKMLSRINELMLITRPGATTSSKLATTQTARFNVVDANVIRKSVSKDPFTKVRESRRVSEQLTAFTRGAREGVYSTKKSVKKVQTDLTDLINKSDLSAVDKAKFLRTIKNIQTPEQLTKRLPMLTKRIDDLVTAASRRKITNQIFKELKLVRPKKVGGIERGQIGAVAQKQIDEMKKFINMKQSDADARLSQILESGSDITPEIAREMDLLRMAGVRGQKIDGKIIPSKKSVKELEDILSQVRHIIETGRTKTELQKFNYESYIDRLKSGGEFALTGGRGLQPTALGIPKRKGLKETFRTIDNWLHGIDTLFDKLSVFDKTNTGKVDGFLNRMLGDKVHIARKAQTQGMRETQEKISTNFAKSFGIDVKNKRALRRIVNENKMESVNISFIDTTGKKVSRDLTPNQVYKKWMELQDPTLRRTFTEGMKWGDPMPPKIKGVADDLVNQARKYKSADDFIEFNKNEVNKSSIPNFQYSTK